MNKKENEKVVLCKRMKAGLFAPIFWIAIIGALFVSMTAVYSATENEASLVFLVISIILMCAIYPSRIVELCKRAKNNRANEDLIIYDSKSDSFIINLLNDEQLIIKRFSFIKVNKNLLYYMSDLQQVTKIKIGYIDNYREVNRFIKRYFEENK